MAPDMILQQHQDDTHYAHVDQLVNHVLPLLISFHLQISKLARMYHKLTP